MILCSTITSCNANLMPDFIMPQVFLKHHHTCLNASEYTVYHTQQWKVHCHSSSLSGIPVFAYILKKVTPSSIWPIAPTVRLYLTQQWSVLILLFLSLAAVLTSLQLQLLDDVDWLSRGSYRPLIDWVQVTRPNASGITGRFRNRVVTKNSVDCAQQWVGLSTTARGTSEII